MKKLAIVVSAVFAVAGLVSTAHAATIDVDYTLGGPGFVQVGGSGTATFGPPVVTNAKAKLRYDSTATPPGSIVAGAVHIQSFSFFQPFSIKTLFSVPSATVNGYIGFQFYASQLGALSAGGGLALPALAGVQPLPIHCNAAACAIFGLTGFTSVTFSAGTPFTGLSLLGTGHLGTAPGALALSVPQLTNFLGASVTFNVTGTEVSRTFIPEPTTGSMLALGLLGLAAFSGLARRRR
jgi:hypothetical protein